MHVAAFTGDHQSTLVQGWCHPCTGRVQVIPSHNTACHSACMQNLGDRMLQHMNMSALEVPDNTYLSHHYVCLMALYASCMPDIEHITWGLTL